MQEFQYKHGDRPLAGYTIQRAAGHGGFGEVYYAVSDSGREVALKAVQSYEQIELRGIRQCMNLKSSHLVTIFDVKYNDQGRPFVIMEYIAGPSLRELIDQLPGGLGVQKAAFFLREIGKGLTFLHDRGIIHRDLKPENVFYEDGCVKIGDYGLSKTLAPTPQVGQTITVGTVHYMAPEIGTGVYDCRIDVYSLGVVLFEMLTGKTPFHGGSVAEILMKHMTAEPNVTAIEEPFAAVIRRALAKEPNDRYETVQEMVEAVFGTEHIRQSVSHFSPASLSVVAQRAVQPVVTVGAGPGGGPPSSRVGGSESCADDLWGKLSGRLDRVGQRLSSLGQRLGLDWSSDSGEPGKASDGIVDPARDPLDRRHRRILAFIAAATAAVGVQLFGFQWRGRGLSIPGTDDMIGLSIPGGGGMMAFLMILGASYGILFVRRRLLPKLETESSLLRHLVTGGIASLGVLVASWVFWANASVNLDRHMPGSLLAIASGLILLNWWTMTAPDRAERVSLGHALLAGGIGFAGATVFDGIAQMAIGVLAGTSLVVQTASPFDPQARRRPRRRQAGFDAVQAAPAAGGAGPPTDQVHRHAYGPPHATTSLARPVHPAIRVLFLIGFVGLSTLGLMLILSFGVVRYGKDESVAVLSAGIGAAMFSLLCLVKATQRTFRSWWSSFAKPVLMLICILSIVTSIMCLGSLRLKDETTIAALFFIIFPSILFVVIAAIPNAAFRGQPVASGDRYPVGVGGPADVSPCKRLPTLLLALALYFGFGGLHRFYVGKIGTGIIWLLTAGGFVIGQIVDIIMILTGQFKDINGRRVVLWRRVDQRDDGKVAPSPFPEPRAVGASVRPPDEGETHPRSTHVPAEGPRSYPVMHSLAQAPTQTSLLLSVFGCLLLFVAFVIGLAGALRLPDAVAAGLPDFSLARELDRGFGTAAWPGLVYRLGRTMVVAVMSLAAVALVIARRRAGVAHMFRALVGVMGLLLTLYTLTDAFARINWYAIATMINKNETGPALQMFLDATEDGVVILAVGLLVAGVFVLAWPEKRPLIGVSNHQGEWK